MDSSKDQKEQQGQEKQFSIQPIKENTNPELAAHKAHPGPAIVQNMPSEEGSKEERQARKEELNK